MNNKYTELTAEQAQEQLKKWGLNEIKDPDPTNPLKLIIRQLKKNFILYLLVSAALISFFVGETLTAYTILLVSLMVISITFIQEYRAERAIKDLKEMITPVSIVIRDGRQQEVISKYLVPEDILILRAGEKIPADCVLLEESNLRINESILTGESKEVVKKVDDPLFMGSFIANGRCLAKVTHTGMNTRFGGIVQMISKAEKELPLQLKVNTIARYMVIIASVMALSTGVLMLSRSTPLTLEVLTGILILVIALCVSAFPEGLPVVLVTTLAMGANRMAKKNAIVNRMSIIETLGETTVICSDKTGTLTKGEMTVKKILISGQLLSVGGTGYEAKGNFLINDQPVEIAKNPALHSLLKAAVLCNDAHIERTGEDEIYKALGSPTEAALLIMAAKGGVFLEDLSSTRLEEIPFNSQRKMMSVLCQLNSENIVFAKGALEVLLKHCDSWQNDIKIINLTKAERDKILNTGAKLAQGGFRTLALAYKKLSSSQKDYAEDKLIFLGLIAMEDPPREEVGQAITTCKAAGIEVKMITGDSKDTAISVANQINLPGKVVEGEELDKMTDDELSRVIKEIVIFARVKPEHKLRIVKLLKQNGEIVTMTGDGVNDAPALKEAQIGVAMGENGTDVSRSVADLTLKDDNFATIVEAIREGRTIFNNIRKFVSYQLSCNFAELIIISLGVLLAPLLGWEVPLILALQILFMNLVTDDLPAITLAFNKSSHDVMKIPPRKKAEILNKPLVLATISIGIFMALLTMSTYFITYNILGQSTQVARTAALITLILLEIVNAFNFRSFRYRVLNRSPFINIYLFYASIISILATIIIIYSPLNQIFETTPISILVWGLGALTALVFLIIFDLLKGINNHTNILRLY